MPLTPAGVPWALGFCATGGGGAGILRGLCGQPTMPAPPLAGRAPGPLRGGRRGHGPLRAPGWRWWPGTARRGRTRRRSRVATTGRRVRGTCRGGEGPPPEDSWAPVEKALTFAPPRLMIAPMRPGRYLDAPGPRRRGLRGHEARGGCQFCRKGGSRSARPVGTVGRARGGLGEFLPVQRRRRRQTWASGEGQSPAPCWRDRRLWHDQRQPATASIRLRVGPPRQSSTAPCSARAAMDVNAAGMAVAGRFSDLKSELPPLRP